MSNVVVAMFLTLDGVMEDPGGGEGFQHGGWQLPFFDQEMATGVRDGLFAAALLLGRVTYEQSAAAWASMTDEEGFARSDEHHGQVRCLHHSAGTAGVERDPAGQ